MISRPLVHRRHLLGLLAGTVIASGLTRAGQALSADLALASAGDGALTIEYDSRLHSRLIRKSDNLALTDFAPSDTLTLKDGTIVDAFALAGQTKTAVTDRHGKGTRFVITGRSADAIEKTVTVTFYEKYPGFALVTTRYRNGGTAAIDVAGWRGNGHTLKASGAGFWSWSGATFPDRRDWVQPVKDGFDQPNFMGMNASDYGSGTPVVDAWRPDAGIATGHIEVTPKLISLPLLATPVGAAIAIDEVRAVTLKPGDSLDTLDTFVTIHTRDYYATLDTYRRIMADRGLAAPKPPEGAYEAIWCAWGYDRIFNVAEIEGTYSKVKELGFKWAVLDDGWQTNEGDWNLDPRKFRSDAEMIAFVKTIRAAGLKPKLWLAPLAVDPGADLLHDHTDMLLLDENGAVHDVTWWNAFYLCPAYEPTRDYTKKLIHKIIAEWGYEGLKLDGQHMNGVAPCYNPLHNHARPEESVEKLQDFWKLVYDTAREANPQAVVEFCPCGTSYAFHNLPFVNQVPASDPLSSWQVRHKGKSLKALMGRDAAYAGDHVELSDNGNDWASTVGIGAVISTKFTWPNEGRGKDAKFRLTAEREAIWRKWADIYNARMLPKGQYLGELYDIGFDKPEAHAVAKDGKLYYGFYAPQWSGEIELRGLKSGKYRVTDYFNGKDLGTVTASSSRINASFEKFLLIEAVPAGKA
ncbi:glycoside hydrolase clan GH-D [Asticcacaulis sp. AC460]|uniref:glycoside hydrolase family 36 protein n=1 Tax=Asticcacaulis sp. AC460 TaxID=1282360 RepID=UPI0003C3E8C5|nr:glycoside hydrolase family 36 protein [Asticcacaulis sp. AC460]ESQ91043.1 glycoside hydrolase clan GH-D [Asticcacaulis sp. AC460]